MKTQGCSGSVQPGRGPGEPQELCDQLRPAEAPLAPQLHLPSRDGTQLTSVPPGRVEPWRALLVPTAKRPSAPTVLTSSLCVDGHFFRRRPQLSRFPVCRCRVLARARSAPAARLSVPMAAATRGDRAAPEPRREGERTGERASKASGRADGCLARRGGAPGPRGEREAADSARPQPGVRSSPRRPGGDGEAVAEGGREGGRRRRGRSLRLLRPPLEPPPPPPPKRGSCFLEDND